MVDGREDGPADVSKATEDYPGINLSLSRRRQELRFLGSIQKK